MALVRPSAAPKVGLRKFISSLSFYFGFTDWIIVMPPSTMQGGSKTGNENFEKMVRTSKLIPFLLP
jgi:hypothetical protein